MQLPRDAKIYVAGHAGLVGSAIWRELQRQDFKKLVGRRKTELNLLDTAAVQRFYAEQKPDYVFVSAARVGGIVPTTASPPSFSTTICRSRTTSLTELIARV